MLVKQKARPFAYPNEDSPLLPALRMDLHQRRRQTHLLPFICGRNLD
jgi:hypothetical protein